MLSYSLFWFKHRGTLSMMFLSFTVTSPLHTPPLHFFKTPHIQFLPYFSLSLPQSSICYLLSYFYLKCLSIISVFGAIQLWRRICYLSLSEDQIFDGLTVSSKWRVHSVQSNITHRHIFTFNLRQFDGWRHRHSTWFVSLEMSFLTETVFVFYPYCWTSGWLQIHF